ncbi:MAG TPA: hypothetical protein VG960_00940 [Caulobacteraceae bacterium]|nr:hypothetical protein [Caulobacteraceae bacterium]
MQGAKYNIRVTPLPGGWRWELIDQGGGSILSGAAPDHEGAMESGWRAVRSFVPASSKQYPEIVLGDCNVRH